MADPTETAAAVADINEKTDNAEQTNGQETEVKPNDEVKTDATEDKKITEAENNDATTGAEAEKDNGVAEKSLDSLMGKDDADSKPSEVKRKRSASPNRDDDSQNKRSKFTNNNSRQGHIKSKFDHLEESDDHDDIRRQVEFYFSDSNLPIDKYLLSLVGVQENKPVDLKIIHSFKRMQRYQPFSAVRDAVKASDFLVLNENDHVSRKKPLDDKYTDDVHHNKQLLHDSSLYRSIYAKGFGEETKDTHINIENFFRLYTDFKSLRLRRDDDGYFKGSVFVEFESEDAANDFLGLENKPEFEGKELTIMSKQKYVEDKNQGILDGTVRPRSPLGYNSRAGRGRGRGRGGNDRNGRGRDRDGRGRGDRRGGDRKGRDDYGRDEGRRARSPNRRGRGGKFNKRDRSGSRDARGVYKGDLDDWKKRREHDNRDDGEKAEKGESKSEEANKNREVKAEEVKTDGGKDVSVEA